MAKRRRRANFRSSVYTEFPKSVLKLLFWLVKSVIASYLIFNEEKEKSTQEIIAWPYSSCKQMLLQKGYFKVDKRSICKGKYSDFGCLLAIIQLIFSFFFFVENRLASFGLLVKWFFYPTAFTHLGRTFSRAVGRSKNLGRGRVGMCVEWHNLPPVEIGNWSAKIWWGKGGALPFLLPRFRRPCLGLIKTNAVQGLS